MIHRGWALLLLATLLAPGCARFRRGAPAAEPPPALPETGGLPYAVRFEGLERPELQTLIEESSQLLALKDTPPISIAGLRRRTRDDVERFDAALRSEGYYANAIAYDIDRTAEPIQVTIALTPGPRYTLGAYTIAYAGPHPPPDARTDLETLGLHMGMPARAPTIVEAQTRYLRRLAQVGRPRATVTEREVIVDHAQRNVLVTLRIDPGPVVHYGPTTVTGTTTVEPTYLLRLLPWKEGERYDERQMEKLRERLRDTHLFAGSQVRLVDSLDEAGRAPVSVVVDERTPHTIAAGVKYSTDEGAGVDASWEHRNIFGEGERLRITGLVSELRQVAKIELRKPHYLALHQTLVINTGYVREDSDAFEEQTVPFYIGLERKLNPLWTVSAGFLLEYSRIDDNEGRRDFGLYGVPVWAARDNSDDALDPTAGTRLRMEVTPYTGGGDESLSFVVSELIASAYQSLREDDRAIVAARVRGGSIFGENTETLPANKRFYSGGGGSVRGYEFQKVGPLDPDEDPLGGRSVVELGLELRLRVTERFGVVPFIEGGYVYDDAIPEFDEDPLWAAGIGGRYFTAIGPLRLDIAFPINGRKDIDEDFQFYLSLGQAF